MHFLKWLWAKVTGKEEVKWRRGAGEVVLSGKTSFTFYTQGMTHPEKPNPVGHEFVFFWMVGEGFGRFMLMQMSGNRGVRAILEDDHREGDKCYLFDIANDYNGALMGESKWGIDWDGTELKLLLNDKKLEGKGSGGSKTYENFTGTPTRGLAGGHPNSQRNFTGEWRMD